MQIHGGLGLTNELGLEGAYRFASHLAHSRRNQRDPAPHGSQASLGRRYQAVSEVRTSLVSVSNDQGVRTVVLDRAEARNALSPDLRADLREAAGSER